MIHGVTSYAEWRVKERTANRVVFAMDDNDATRRAWPHRFHAELKQAIKELETPRPEVINAYAKFAGDNSAMERAAKAREKAGALRNLLKEVE